MISIACGEDEPRLAAAAAPDCAWRDQRDAVLAIFRVRPSLRNFPSLILLLPRAVTLSLSLTVTSSSSPLPRDVILPHPVMSSFSFVTSLAPLLIRPPLSVLYLFPRRIWVRIGLYTLLARYQFLKIIMHRIIDIRSFMYFYVPDIIQIKYNFYLRFIWDFNLVANIQK